MTRFLVAAIAAVTFASSSFAGTTGNGATGATENAVPANPTSGGPYTMDVNGKCHAANGQLADKGKCAMAATPIHCRNSQTNTFSKCGTPDAVPAP